MPRRCRRVRRTALTNLGVVIVLRLLGSRQINIAPTTVSDMISKVCILGISWLASQVDEHPSSCIGLETARCLMQYFFMAFDFFGIPRLPICSFPMLRTFLAPPPLVQCYNILIYIVHTFGKVGRKPRLDGEERSNVCLDFQQYPSWFLSRRASPTMVVKVSLKLFADTSRRVHDNPQNSSPTTVATK